MKDIESLHSGFETFFPEGCRLEKLHSGMKWAEGPVYFPLGDYLLWSDIPNDRMFRYVRGLGVSVFREPAKHSNGNTRDLQGRLITCEHDGQVTRTEVDGSVTVLVDKYRGKRLNSPNDAVVKSDGTIWFTDPPYGILSNNQGYQRESEIGSNNVYRFDPVTEELTMICDNFVMPNGIAFSPDEKRLFIADTGKSHDNNGPHHIRVFDISPAGTLSGDRVFAEINPGLADGFRFDTEGNLWTSAGDGVHCISPEGNVLGKVLVPETVANVEFGGPDRNQLYICATTSLYVIETTRRGIR